MAQFNITLNQEEILQLLLEDRGDAFKSILQDSLNKILQVESLEQIKAAPYERSEDRTDSRNGTRERELNTRIGRIVLHVPRHRNVPFKTLVFDNYSRSEAALIASMAEQRSGTHCKHGRDGRQWRVHPQGLQGHGNALRNIVLQVHGI